MRNAYKILDGKTEWKRSLGRNDCRWKDNIKSTMTDSCEHDNERLDAKQG
jgi:hypothetical protein